MGINPWHGQLTIKGTARPVALDELLSGLILKRGNFKTVARQH